MPYPNWEVSNTANYWTTSTVSTTNNLYFTSGWNSTYTPYTTTVTIENTTWDEPKKPYTDLAIKKARKLLRDNVTSQQWKQYLKFGYFEVISETGKVYRILKGRTRNIKQVKDGKAIEVLCIHPSAKMPDEDVMLGQKLMLECDEEALRKIANIEKVSHQLPLAA